MNEIVHILEFPVHAGKPHIGHLVEILEVFHHEFAQRTGLDLGIEIGIHVAFDVRHQPVNLLVTDRSFPAGAGQPVADLFAAKRLATTVLLDDLDGHFFRALVRACSVGHSSNSVAGGEWRNHRRPPASRSLGHCLLDRMGIACNGDFQMEHRPSPPGERVPPLYPMPGARDTGLSVGANPGTAERCDVAIMNPCCSPVHHVRGSHVHDRILQRLWRRSVGGSRLLSPLWTAAHRPGPEFLRRDCRWLSGNQVTHMVPSRPRRRRFALSGTPRCRSTKRSRHCGREVQRQGHAGRMAARRAGHPRW